MFAAAALATAALAGGAGAGGGPPPEPLAARQWDMRMIHATARGSYARERADHRVRVALLDTGGDARHPDLAPNFSRRLSRDCSGAGRADRDAVGHGTHVAGTIAAARNGL